MATQIIVQQTEHLFLAEMNRQGLSPADIEGPFKNSSGWLYAFFDDGVAPDVDVTVGAAGVSSNDASGGGTNVAEVGTDYTSVTDEVLGAVALPDFSGTTANQVVIPGTVVIDDSGAAGPTIVDDGAGVLLEQVTQTRRGTINYITGEVDITYRANEVPTGNVEIDYEHSAVPDHTDMPITVMLKGVTLSGFAATTAVTVNIYEDEARTVLRFAGGGTTDGSGDLFIALDLVSRTAEVADLTKRGKRWVLIGGDATAGNVSLAWERRWYAM